MDGMFYLDRFAFRMVLLQTFDTNRVNLFFDKSMDIFDKRLIDPLQDIPKGER